MNPRSSPHNPLSLRFNVHWTQASSRPPAVPRMALPQGMYLRPGRPDIHATLKNATAGVIEACASSRSRNRSSTTPSGVVIGTCGPTSLIDDAVRAVGRVNWSDWGEVGGVESIEEYVYHFNPHGPCRRWSCTQWIGILQGIWAVRNAFSLFFWGFLVYFDSMVPSVNSRKGRFKCPIIFTIFKPQVMASLSGLLPEYF